MTTAEFRALSPQEAASLSPPLQALWHDAHGDWNAAHSLVDELDTPDACRVHAYLHRKEGNYFNANYWDRRGARLSGQPAFTGSLDDEWTALAIQLLNP